MMRNVFIPAVLLAISLPCFGQAGPRGGQIDPQQIQDLAQQVRNGQLDPNQAVQSLIDSGAIAPDTITRLQRNTQDRTLNNLRQQLSIESDEEWGAIAPHLQAVIAATNALGENTGRGGIGGILGTLGQPPSAVAQAQAALRDALEQGNDGVLAARLDALRRARTQARASLQNAREGLRNLLTLRQEGILVILGYLD